MIYPLKISHLEGKVGEIVGKTGGKIKEGYKINEYWRFIVVD